MTKLVFMTVLYKTIELYSHNELSLITVKDTRLLPVFANKDLKKRQEGKERIFLLSLFRKIGLSGYFE